MILDIRAVTNALGGEVISRNQALAPSPGHSKRDRSLSVTIFIAYSHASGDDDWQAIRDYVREKLGLPAWAPDPNYRKNGRPAAPAVGAVRESAAGRASDDQVRAAQGLTTTADAMKLCRESVDPRGTLVEKYLNSRKLDLTPDLVTVLRWHPGAQAMLALFRDIETGLFRAVSRTFLDQDAKKIGKAKFTGPVKGAAIMLDPFDAVLGGLHVGAGVETVLTGRQYKNFKPAWALGSDAGIKVFPVLAGIEAITLIQENDDNGSSQLACEACASHWDAVGREVFIDEPKSGFNDINDVIRGKPS